jgi:hypothetical protein
MPESVCPSVLSEAVSLRMGLYSFTVDAASSRSTVRCESRLWTVDEAVTKEAG